MTELISKKDLLSSLELLEEINFWRLRESENSKIEKAELRHDTLRSIIQDEFEEEILSQEILEKKISSNGGRPYQIYCLTPSQAKQVLLRESKFVRKAVIKKLDELEKIILQKQSVEWQEARNTGKISRRQETDAIKLFVEYAKKQGSKNADKYYMNISKMENKSLFFITKDTKNIREKLSANQLITLNVADRVIEKALFEGMESSLHYKEIYKIARFRVEQLGMIIPKEDISHRLIEKAV